MKAFELADLLEMQAEGKRPYLEFLNERSLSMGLYILPANGVDKQQPHTEDEVYYVVEGRASITIAGKSRPVQPGSVIYVAAGVEHYFHRIVEDLAILVFFAPAESSQVIE